MDDRRVRAEAIEDFAATLRELRNSVGNPSFREMSGRSKAISHTTLHEATKGNRLPSWETTVEFVKACGADPAAYRERWEKANLAVRSASAGDPARADIPAVGSPGELAASAAERHTVHIAIGSQAPRSAADTSPSVPAPPPPDTVSGNVQPVLPAPGGRKRFRLTRPAAAAAALATAAVGTGVVVLIVAAVNHGSEPDERSLPPAGSPSIVSPSPAVCPVVATNPPSAPPVHKGDAAEFVADVTLRDCSKVGTGKTVTKIWRLRNSGTVPWKGYWLHRIDLPQQADQCQTISDVPIKDTQPGKTVNVKTVVTTPKKPGFCYVRFKMVDASGKVMFPGSRPVNFQIIVE